ncbi:MAG: hypothetical protein ACXVXT_04045 [Blastococcus sp.]
MLAAGRSAARGALVGVGLLVATGAGAPAALADDAPAQATTPPQVDPHVAAAAPATPLNAAPVVPGVRADRIAADFGLGKQSAVQIAVQPDGNTPPDLDRSGATFTFTGGGITATCTTDVSGTCGVSVATGAMVTDGLNLQLPPGTYTVVQTEASPGLKADVGDSWTFSLWPAPPVASPGVSDAPPVVVLDTSLFRRNLSARVVGAGAPLAGATYALAGPDYPHNPAVRGTDGIYRATALTHEDGVLSYDGWFMPGQWTLTPTTVPDGYDKGSPATVVVPEAAPDTDTVSGADIVLEPTVVGGEVGDPGTGTQGTGGTGTPLPGPVPAPHVPAPPVTHPSSAGTHRPSTASVVVVPQIPVLVSVTPPVPATTGPTPPVTADLPETVPSDVVAGPPAPAPRLAPASSSYVEVGAIGFGILLVALAVIGVGVVRRRARARG